MNLANRPRFFAGHGLTRAEEGRRWGRWLLVLAVVGSALGLGGAHPVVVVATTFTLSFAGLLTFSAGSSSRVPGPSLLLGGLALYTLFQAVPLPLNVLAFLSPQAADVWSRALRPLGEAVTWGSLSLDPGASSLEAAKWLSYALAFALAATIGRRQGVAWAVVVVFVSALLVALATLGHGLLQATRVFGIYQPSFGPSRWSIGPILNPNCLAGYLNVGAVCGLGLTFAGRQTLPRWLWALGVAVLIGVSLLAGSRGGAVALFAAIAVFAVGLARLPVVRARLRRLGWLDWAGLAAAVMVGLVFSALGARGLSFEQLFQKDVEKVKLSAWTLELLADFPVFGIGRGAFEGVFPAYRTGLNNLIYSHPENIVAQWVSEWGVLVGVASLATFAWMLRPSRVAAGERVTALAAFIGVGALVVQNLVDLSLELIGPALAASVLLGCCWGHARSKEPRTAEHPRRRSMAGVVAAAALLGTSLLAAWLGTRPVAQERLELRKQYAATVYDDQNSIQQLFSELRGAMLRHPAEPYFPRLGALLAIRSGKSEPLPWIQRALERSLTDGRTHMVLAHVLNARGVRHQALLEARLAAEYDATLADEIGTMLARWPLKPDEFDLAAPRGRAGVKMLYAAARATNDDRRRPLQERLYRLTIERDPAFVLGHRALAHHLLEDLQRERCAGPERAECEREILRLARKLDAANPQSAEAAVLISRLYSNTERHNEGQRLLEQRCPKFDDAERLRCWSTLVSITRPGKDDPSVIVRATNHYVKDACRVDPSCEQALARAGDALAGAGQWVEALSLYERAVRLDATPTLLLKLATAAKALGRFSIAERALTSAAAKAGDDERLRHQIQRHRQALIRLTFQ